MMRRFLPICVLWMAAAAAQTAGPPHGTLIAVGGGEIGPDIAREFMRLAGGPDAPVVVIPTAGEAAAYEAPYLDTLPLRRQGMRNLTLLHTRDRAVADTAAFTAPLTRARAVWFTGGRQWRLVDAYLGTRTERELHALLDRGGLIGGTSAGATILGSYLVRGAREGNQIMMAPGYERGFGFLRGAAIDQHLIRRRRERDLVAVIAAHPELLGIGIDESTAIVVEGNRLRVIGRSKVAIYDHTCQPAPGSPPYYFLSPGDAFELTLRHRVTDSLGGPLP